MTDMQKRNQHKNRLTAWTSCCGELMFRISWNVLITKPLGYGVYQILVRISADAYGVNKIFSLLQDQEYRLEDMATDEVTMFILILLLTSGK